MELPFAIQQFLRPEQAGNGFVIGDFPHLDPFQRFGQRQREHLQMFAIIKTRTLEHEPLCQVIHQFFIGITDAGV